MVNAQEFISNNCSIQATEIKVAEKNLEGEVDLREYKKLKKLEVQYNKITSLNLTSCPDLERLDIGGNLITKLDLGKNLKLKWISVSGLSIKQDLNTFSHLKNLEHLCLDSSDFYGSLRLLPKTSLKNLYLRNNPNIKEGWEFLPATLKTIGYDKKPNLFSTLANYQDDFPKWRKDHGFLINQITKKEEEIVKYKKNLEEQEKITKKVLAEKEKLQKQLEQEKQTFLTAANNLNGHIAQLKQLEAKIEIPSKQN